MSRPARVGVLVFPGSLDDRDLARGLSLCGADVQMIWHKDARLPELDGIGVPGGFSYGDYLRCGAMARFSPVMRALLEFASGGRPVLGICNGFQILCEARLLPGALVRNAELRYVCQDVRIAVDDPGQMRSELAPGRELVMPVKHGEGAYVPDPEHKPRVAFRYVGGNPNGSTDDIAGVVNDAGNVLGLMPHPEHAVDPLLGSTDGARLLRSFLSACTATRDAR
ncbi:MAG: phosphoribosylformylglycinamidine synthase subunit PurQ [Deltaproteobacteria bacterium]|nr:phosphoribosylformylglycinamidine synthase subunit PurQ [Deltaproteobacteria bacterium]